MIQKKSLKEAIQNPEIISVVGELRLLRYLFLLIFVNIHFATLARLLMQLYACTARTCLNNHYPVSAQAFDKICVKTFHV